MDIISATPLTQAWGVVPSTVLDAIAAPAPRAATTMDAAVAPMPVMTPSTAPAPGWLGGLDRVEQMFLLAVLVLAVLNVVLLGVVIDTHVQLRSISQTIVVLAGGRKFGGGR